MRKITGEDLIKKADFLSQNLDYKIVIRNGKQYSYIWFDYGCEGNDCVFTGTISECNNYLNRLLRKHCLSEDWKEYNEHDWSVFED